MLVSDSGCDDDSAGMCFLVNIMVIANKYDDSKISNNLEEL